MSQTLSAFLLHTLKYVLFVHKRRTYLLGIVNWDAVSHLAHPVLILFYLFAFFVQIAQGQVEETMAEVIGVSEIQDTCHFSVVYVIPERIYAGHVNDLISRLPLRLILKTH